jgi:hypothetical protein
MNTSFLSRHRIARIALVAAGTLALCSGGAYALASTGKGTTVSSPPHSAQRAHLPGGRLMCPMIRANEPATGLCARIGPIRACPPNAMCVRPCVMPVVVMTPAHPGDPVPPKMVMHGRCVILRGVNPGGPMIPAGSAGASGSAAGSPPAVKP